MTGQGREGLVSHLVRFAAALRAQGIPVGLEREADAAAALLLLDVADRAEVRLGLRIAFGIPVADWTLFDRLFDESWSGAEPRPPEARQPRAFRDHRGPLRWAWDGVRVHLDRASDAGPAEDGRLPGYSPDASGRRRRLGGSSRAEAASMERVLRRLAARLTPRRSRRLVPTRGRGTVDLRRSFRRAVGTYGELLALARRERQRTEPPLVVLCDTSGSMESHTGFLLTLVVALRRVWRRAEVFAFNTALTRLTPWIVPADLAGTLTRISRGVPDWSGGTQIGACLAEFVRGRQFQRLGRDAVVMIVSDGLDLGEPEQLIQAMRAVRARARTVIWLNPLLGDARYRPAAAGMQAALPFVDHLGPAHDVPSLERFVELLVPVDYADRKDIRRQRTG